MTQKSAQYESGRRAYLARARNRNLVKFDPALRPEPLLPEDILAPLMARALKGETYSQISLGDIYRSGGMVGVAADKLKARRWYRLAVAGGSVEAAEKLRTLESNER